MSFTPPPDLAPRIYDAIASSFPGIPRLGDVPAKRRKLVLGAITSIVKIVVVAVAAEPKTRH